MINVFLSSRNLYRCNLAMSYKVDYTFHNDSSNCYSHIDYFVTSDSQLITKFEVLDYGSFLCGQQPVAITLGYTLAPIVSKPSSSCHPSQVNYVRWDHADLQFYYSVTGQLLQQLHSMKLTPNIFPHRNRWLCQQRIQQHSWDPLFHFHRIHTSS